MGQLFSVYILVWSDDTQVLSVYESSEENQLIENCLMIEELKII